MPDTFKDQTVAVVGLGRSGLASARALSSAGAQVTVWDDSESARDKAEELGFTVTAPENNAPATLLLAPGVPLTHPAPHPAAAKAREAGIPIIGDIEVLYRSCPQARYIGITGTNGKSTTTALLGHILRDNGRATEVGGNLGTPALDLAPLDADGVYVLEMSSYQLDLIDTVRFDTSILLNITPDHLDRHGGMDGYIAAKQRVFTGPPESGAAVIGIDSAPCREIAYRLADTGRRVVPVSVTETVKGGVYVAGNTLVDAMDGDPAEVLSLADVPALPGLHNAQNIAAAYAAARLEGLPRSAIAAAIQTFPGLAHRLQTVAERDGIRFVNDSKATNADAAATALASFPRIYWIAGGREKDGGYAQLAPYLPAVKKAFLIGEAGPSMAEALQDSVPVEICGTIDRAVQQASTLAMSEGVRGSVVLLSPACASFDQFTSFEQRGDVFVAEVRSFLASKGAAV